MIKNTYSAPSTTNTALLPDPRVLQFLKLYSQSLELMKGKKASIFIGKN
jgi:hypothetical protein